MENLQENRLTVRHNKLINARIKLNSKSYDLVRSFASLIKKDDVDFWTYSLEVASLNIDYKQAKSLIKNIMRNPLEMQDDKTQKFKAYAWFQSMTYENGVISARISDELKPFFLELNSNFTKTLEKYIIPMSSIYAKRLYELLSEYKTIGYRKFILSDLQDKLQVSKSMKPYYTFKNKALKIAIEQINLHTDIYLNTKEEDFWLKLQCGRLKGITHLNFTILDNPNRFDEQALILKWVDKIRKKFANKKLMEYTFRGKKAFISVSSPPSGKGRMYLQDENGNSLGYNIAKEKSIQMWTFMYKNQDKLLIKLS